MPRTGTMKPPSLVPEDVKPEECRRLRCKMELFREGVLREATGEITFSLLRQDLAAFGHTRDGRTDTLPIPIADLEDYTIDIWGTRVKPWLESLHGAAPDST